MLSGCGTIVMLFFLALVSGSKLRDPKITDNYQGSKLTSGQPRLLVRDERKDDNVIMEKSRLSYHTYGNRTTGTETDMNDLQSTSNNWNSTSNILSLAQNINISHFDQANANTERINTYSNIQEKTAKDEYAVLSNQPVANVILQTRAQIGHRSHRQGQILEGNDLEFIGPLPFGISQIADVQSVSSSSIEINSSCCKISKRIADCKCCGLTSVPIDLPRDITKLVLTDNYISSEVLYSGVFENYTHLDELLFDSNNITFLPDGVFEGLEHLETLSLNNNKITLNKKLNNSTVFYPFNNTLQRLILSGNTRDLGNDHLVYPDQALSVLTNLTELYIDGLRHKEFGIGFSNLTKLTHLYMEGFRKSYCNMISISNNTFSYLKHLTYLRISHCFLNGSLIEADAFSSLSELRFLDVSFNFDLGIHAVGRFMYGLRNNTNFVHLSMECIIMRYEPCVVVYSHMLKYFRYTVLRVIEAMNNEIEMIEVGALDMLPSTLETLNVSGNKIMFGAYWKDMASLKGLKQLHLNDYVSVQRFPVFFPSENFQCPDKTENGIFNVKKKHRDEKCICESETCSSVEQEFILPLPPTLQVFTMRSTSLSYKVDNGIRFCSTNNLTSVDLSDNMFKYLGGSVIGLNYIRDLNLSSSFIDTIGDDFFDNLTSLENLNLFQNLLGDCLNKDSEGKIFDKLKHVKNLNLSYNSLFRLNKLAFKDLINLENLDLSTNSLSDVNFSIKHMTHLAAIDFHKNDITTLPEHITDALDTLLTRQKVIIDMSSNPINCDCSNKEFLEWVVRSKVLVGNFSNYYCKYQDGKGPTLPMINGYEDEVIRLRRSCSIHWILLLCVTGGTLLLILFIVGFLLYRFRWKLRYWYHAAKMKIYTNPHQVSEDFEYDVFVSYASEDVNFVLRELSPHLSTERHLKLMLHGEKFQVGRYIADNIYMAVRQCRKTLVLVTKNMLASHWCTYELQMARSESISRGRDVLVFLFLEEIPTSLMSIDVMVYIKTSTYIFYPKDFRHREAFWNKLAHDLRDQ